jgi:hypothetical protein
MDPSIKDNVTKSKLRLTDYLIRFIKDFKEHQNTLQPRLAFPLLMNLQNPLMVTDRIRIAIKDIEVNKLYDRTLEYGNNLSTKELNNIYGILLIMESFVSITVFHDRFSDLKTVKRLISKGQWIGLKLDPDFLQHQNLLAEDLKQLCNEELSIVETTSITQLLVQHIKSFYKYDKLISKKRIIQPMATFSQQLNPEAGEVLIHDKLPQSLRVQIVHIITDAIGKDYYVSYASGSKVEEAYKAISDILCREYGVFELNNYRTYEEKMANFILQEQNIDRVLDVIELSFHLINAIPDMNEHRQYVAIKLKAPEAIEELNERFKQHGIGYSYEIDRIIKVATAYTHVEVVKPTLQLLTNPKFAGANEEYLKAHEHYRHGRNKECLAECLKAFESTIKIICTEKRWHFNESDTSRVLVNLILTNNLVPTYIQSQLTSLRSLLESGIPTLRNRLGGHGQGASQTLADDETTRYGLNLTGSNIIYLIELSDM